MVRRVVVCFLLGSLSTASIATGSGQTAAPSAAAPAPASAQTTANVPHLTAAQIVDKNVAARGGLEAWRRVKSMRLTGKIDVGTLRKPIVGGMPKEQYREQLRAAAAQGGEAGKVVQVPFLMELERPRKSRLEMEVVGTTAIQVYDGERGWKLRPYLNRKDVEAYTEDELKVAAQQQELDGPLIDYAAKGNKVELAGIEQVEGRNDYKLKVTLKSGTVRYVWIDAQTFLDSKIDGPPRMLDRKPHAVATYFREYKSVDNLLVPYVLETKVDRVRDSQKITVEKVTFNPSLTEARFGKL